MTDYYLDASALVKRYANEPGSTRIRQITDPLTQNTVLIAEITLAEVYGWQLTARSRVHQYYLTFLSSHDPSCQ